MDAKTAFYMGRAFELAVVDGMDEEVVEMLQDHCPAALQLVVDEASVIGSFEPDNVSVEIQRICVQNGFIEPEDIDDDEEEDDDEGE